MYPCEMSDEALLRECRVETYRGSGPGGQKKNKTSSAVRVTHVPTGVVATGTESRSQHENKARALARLRLALATELRRPWDGVPEWWGEATDVNGRVTLGAKSERYPMIMATLLDALEHCGASVAEAAEAVGASTSGLVADLAGDPVVWARVQSMRQAHGLHPLSNPRR